LEKLKPHYDLATIKSTFSTVAKLRMTRTASNSALALGMSLQDVVDVVQQSSRGSFFKSMTSEADSAIWQDVYHLSWGGLVLYVKFTTDPNGYLLISLKEK
jgi:motility quorum-sensing regulator / GCU-specific mRNA interferase toxin